MEGPLRCVPPGLLAFCCLIAAALQAGAGSSSPTLSMAVTAMTTTDATGSLNDTEDCLCDCEELEAAANRSASAPSTQDEAEEAASRLAEDLKVDTSNLSSTTRRKISAPDDRPSAKGLGAVGAVVIIAVIGTIVALDIAVLVRDSRAALARLLGRWMHETQPPSQPSGQGASHPQSAPVTSHAYTASADEKDGVKGTEDGGEGQSEVVTPAPFPIVKSGGVPDIRSRRELLMKHGERP